MGSVAFESTAAALFAMATFGFTGSLHCAAMCGALSASGCASKKGTLQYHLARLVSYTALGFAAGLLTVALLSPWLAAGGRYLGTAFGILMTVYALDRFVRAWRGKGAASGQSSLSARAYRRMLRLPFPRPVTLGIATAFLPCGFLLAALLQAALLAHPVVSAAGMLVFGLSSSPALLAASGLTSLVQKRAPRAAPVLAASLLLVSALVVLWRSLSPPHVHGEHSGHDAHQQHP